MENRSQLTRFDTATPGSLVTVALSPRDLRAKIVTDSELQNLGFVSAAGALFMTMLGIAIGAGVSLWITLGTVPNLTPNQYAGYLAGLLVSIVCAITFGGLTAFTLRRAQNERKRIERESETREAMLFGSTGPIASRTSPTSQSPVAASPRVP